MRRFTVAFAIGAALAGAQAEAQPAEVTLTIDVSGSGQVAIQPLGVVCAATCSHRVAAGTTVTLEATTDENSTFWGGDCAGASGDACRLVLDADATATVRFSSAIPGPPPPTTGPGESSPPPPVGTVPPTEAPPPATTAPPTTEPPPVGSNPPTKGQTAIDAAIDQLPIGKVDFNTPSRLERGEKAVIHLVLSLRETHEQLERRITEIGEIEGGDLRVSDDMAATLSGPDFRIEALSDERQPVSARDVTEWFWQIEPLESGVLTLRVRISAFVAVDGNEKKREVETFSKQFDINVALVDRVSSFARGNWQWLWTTILVPVAAWFMAHRRGRAA